MGFREFGKKKEYIYGFVPYSGLTWADDYFNTGVALDEQIVWIAGSRIVHTTDGGETWTVEYGKYSPHLMREEAKYTPDYKPGEITRMARAGNRIVAVGRYSQILIRNIEDTPTGISPTSWGVLKREQIAE